MLEICFLKKPDFKGTSSSEIKSSVDNFFNLQANTTPYSPGLLQLIKDLLTPQTGESYDISKYIESEVFQDLKSRGDQTQNSSVQQDSSLPQSGNRPGHSNSTADISGGNRTEVKQLNWGQYDTITFAANKSSPANQVAPVVAVANNEYKLPGIFPLIRSPRIL